MTPKNAVNLEGKTINGIVIKDLAYVDQRGERRWLCVCYCGVAFVARGYDLRRGHVVSCGAHRSERIAKKKTKHGYKTRQGSKIYSAWSSMHQRCKKHKHWHGRGIKVCREWGDFNQFLLDMGEPPSLKHTLERKDNNGNYCKNNCIWALPIIQANNKRCSRIVEHKGRKRTLAQWSRELKIPYMTLWNRWKKKGVFQ